MCCAVNCTPSEERTGHHLWHFTVWFPKYCFHWAFLSICIMILFIHLQKTQPKITHWNVSCCSRQKNINRKVPNLCNQWLFYLICKRDVGMGLMLKTSIWGDGLGLSGWVESNRMNQRVFPSCGQRATVMTQMGSDKCRFTGLEDRERKPTSQGIEGSLQKSKKSKKKDSP